MKKTGSSTTEMKKEVKSALPSKEDQKDLSQKMKEKSEEASAKMKEIKGKMANKFKSFFD